MFYANFNNIDLNRMKHLQWTSMEFKNHKYIVQYLIHSIIASIQFLGCMYKQPLLMLIEYICVHAHQY